MPRLPKNQRSIRRRLMLLTFVPVLGLIATGVISFRTLYSEYQSSTRDGRQLGAFRQEVEEFIAFADQLARERSAALDFMAHREDAQRRAAFEATFAATDRAVDALNEKINRLTHGPQAALFSEKGQSIRSSFATQLPDARTSALEGKRTSGDIFQLYMKLTYSGLFISECYRGTFETPAGLNIFDAILALQKIQQQEIVATDLMRHGLRNGGLQKEELALLRRQFIVSTENEYYLLKFQPDLRAFFKSQTRASEDDNALYTYLTSVAGTLRDQTALPAFTPKTQTVDQLLSGHFQAYERIYTFGFTNGQKALAAMAREHRRHATLLLAALAAVLALSIAINVAITRGTRRDLGNVARRLEQASDDVKSASLQLSSAGMQMSENASRFAEGIDQISTSIAAVSSVADTNKQQAAVATETTNRARAAVDAGQTTIAELDVAMNSARASAQKINQVIARINDISFQTNLLALNAAVEAARAGAAGAGFAVVADEVRQLARRCAEAAKESAQLIGDSANDTGTAIAKSDELASRFKHVSTSIREVNDIVTRISTSFLEQAESIRQIDGAVSNQRSIAQSVAAAAEEIASTAVSMDAQVTSLNASVSEMDAMISGRATARGGSHPEPREERVTPLRLTPSAAPAEEEPETAPLSR